MAVNMPRACVALTTFKQSSTFLSTFSPAPHRQNLFSSLCNANDVVKFARVPVTQHLTTSSNFVRSCSDSAAEKSTRVEDVVEQVSRDLKEAGVPEFDVCGRYLVSQVLGSSKQFGYTHHRDTHLTQDQMEALDRLVSCRMARMPLQYIAGNWDFRSITLQVRPPVFIPRPETEQLVDIVLQHLPQHGDQQIRLLEVGPGTGNICLSLLHENSRIHVTALERSRMAAELTKENAKLLNLHQRLEVHEVKVDEKTSLPDSCTFKQFDAVVSNPPYVLRKDLMALEPEISVYEDLRALDGGAEGLDVIVPILQLAGGHLPVGGLVFLEIDPCHTHILPDHLIKQNLPFRLQQTVTDFNDKDRFLVLRKTEN